MDDMGNMEFGHVHHDQKGRRHILSVKTRKNFDQLKHDVEKELGALWFRWFLKRPRWEDQVCYLKMLGGGAEAKIELDEDTITLEAAFKWWLLRLIESQVIKDSKRALGSVSQIDPQDQESDGHGMDDMESMEVGQVRHKREGRRHILWVKTRKNFDQFKHDVEREVEAIWIRSLLKRPRWVERVCYLEMIGGGAKAKIGLHEDIIRMEVEIKWRSLRLIEPQVIRDSKRALESASQTDPQGQALEHQIKDLLFESWCREREHDLVIRFCLLIDEVSKLLIAVTTLTFTGAAISEWPPHNTFGAALVVVASVLATVNASLRIPTALTELQKIADGYQDLADRARSLLDEIRRKPQLLESHDSKYREIRQGYCEANLTRHRFYRLLPRRTKDRLRAQVESELEERGRPPWGSVPELA